MAAARRMDLDTGESAKRVVGVVAACGGFWCRQRKRIGDNGTWRIGKRNGILYLPGRWFEDDIILLCLRWYFRFKLSYAGSGRDFR